MCTLIAPWRIIQGYDIVIGMNRDESSQRPSDPPSLLPGDMPIVAPRDRKAGGTWVGANGAGIVVALSNRKGRASSTARSRGLLVLDALQRPTVAAVDVLLQREVREHAYNPWNLLAISRSEMRFFAFDGEVHPSRGHEGLNVLTNEGGNVEPDPKVQAVQGLLAKVPRANIDGAIRSLQATLRSHAASGMPAICVHASAGGTVSSTILALSNGDLEGSVLLYAGGPPCSTPYRDYGNVVRRLTGRA
jgi:uncharacterized protein with NRDE domain